MRKGLIFILLSAAVMAAPSVFAQSYLKLLPKPTESLALYPEGQNVDKGLEGALGPGESNGCTKPEKVDGNGHYSYISDDARVDLYFPKKPNGQMIVVCPGGGYWIVSTHNEGGFVADWLLRQGISVAVVTYRLPYGHWEIPLTDVQNVLRYCRSNAKVWGIDQIGVMGYSAGGHLAACATNLYVDEVTKPDFSVLIYPVLTFEKGLTHWGTRVNLIGQDEYWNDRNKTVDEWEAAQKKHQELIHRYSMENQVTADTPPTFLAHSTDDTVVPVENSIRYYRELVRNGVPAEMHIYPTGGHGWGFRDEKFIGKGTDNFKYARRNFEESLLIWLNNLR
ncbi:MAG: alpha/beta hydrolase [Bacteroidales bacterium]|nr:alpha/beta hydrolase [Bacteroidales bacterium]